MSTANRIVLSLISHTNIGKTTLARTLLKQDIGEVRDAPHVTEESEQFVLLQTGDDALILWDTPGFGNVDRLLKRLSQEGGALGWLMHEVVDRAFNRSLYSSLEAARNVRAESDVVLYLINVQEKPEDAGYVDMEMRLLAALGKPVIMILNQVRHEQLDAAHQPLPELVAQWRHHFAHYACLKQVLLLDAFTRTWLQELKLIDQVAALVPPEKRETLQRLRARFTLIQETVFADCSAFAAETLWYAAHQRISAAEEKSPKVIFQSLVADLQSHLDTYLDLLVKRHGIEAEGQVRLKADIQQVTGLVSKPIPEKKSGLLAGAVASAGGGLMADMLVGGLTFGGGALLGFLGGYLGGLSYAKLFNLTGKKGMAAWDKNALKHLFKLLLSYYLVAALHGRGKGKLMVEEPAPFLSANVEVWWPSLTAEVEALVAAAGGGSTDQPDEDYLRAFASLFKSATEKILGSIFKV